MQMTANSGQAMVQQAYQQVQARIVSGGFAPGTVLSESGLAKEFGMSRTPVGEAFRLLAAEGLVEQVPRYGTIVRGVSRDDLAELYEVREALETFAAGQAAEKALGPVLGKLGEFCDLMLAVATDIRAAGRKLLDDAAVKRFLALDMAFHMLILQAAGNRRIVRIVEETRSVSRLFQLRRIEHTAAVVEGAVRQHREILSALRDAKPDEARLRMAAHIRLSKQQALERFDKCTAADRQTAAVSLPFDLTLELERTAAANHQPPTGDNP